MAGGENLFLTGEPMSLEWRMMVALSATQLFTAGKPTEFAINILTGTKFESIAAKPHRTLMDLVLYLEARGITNIRSHIKEVAHIVEDMERRGILYDWGLVEAAAGPVGHAYLTWNYGRAPMGGDLWMARLFGAELIVPSFGGLTIPIPGVSRATGEPDIGSGLVVDGTHIITNAHVIEGMDIDPELPRPKVIPPGRISWANRSPLRVVGAKSHPTIDVGVIEVAHTAERISLNADLLLAGKSEPDRLETLSDLEFRDAEWSDEMYIFGYPPIPMADSEAVPLVVQRGEVVNPNILDRRANPFFLFSAIARPGNSGGPVVSHDGYILGLVSQLTTFKGNEIEAPFYGGVPASQVELAVRDLGYGGLVKLAGDNS
ncbi:S1 family peptidase [Mycolicibacter sinensis]|uniref:S1 family peptidase n=1 Tax=Mycolicibacter sinensis (strain JDM601) TaxID=875328 RepID=UPI0013F4FADB|nr:serine protease [Mycolicibacter sinensis]